MSVGTSRGSGTVLGDMADVLVLPPRAASIRAILVARCEQDKREKRHQNQPLPRKRARTERPPLRRQDVQLDPRTADPQALLAPLRR